jgi:TPR repeat protein
VCALVLQAAEATGVDQDWERLLKASDPAVFTVASPAFLMAWASRYENGVRVGRDYARARQLYCAAARRGHTPAQVRLARMYAHGLGTPRDRQLAGAWLRVAAAQGSSEARRFLAFLDYPPRGRAPRCTYERRVEQYAGAKGASSSRAVGAVDGTGDRSAAGD